MRATAQNPTAASLMGIRLNQVVMTTFFVGSFLGAIGGVAVAINKGSFDYQIGLYIGLVAFAAAVILLRRVGVCSCPVSSNVDS